MPISPNYNAKKRFFAYNSGFIFPNPLYYNEITKFRLKGKKLASFPSSDSFVSADAPLRVKRRIPFLTIERSHHS